MNISELTIFEGMTSISALIKAAEASLNNRKIVKILYDKSRQRQKARQIAFLKAKSELLSFSLEALDASEIDALASGQTHGGFIALTTDRVFPSLTPDDIKNNGIYYLLEGVEDPYNFGYTLRALYAAGADGVLMPQRNWMTSAGVVARSSAGCSELIDLYIFDDPESVAKLFKSKGYRILTANIRDSEMLYDANLSAPLLFVIGGEKRGISSSFLSISDLNIRIGYGRDFSGSLPTAEAAAIISFEVAKINKRIK